MSCTSRRLDGVLLVDEWLWKGGGMIIRHVVAGSASSGMDT